MRKIVVTSAYPELTALVKEIVNEMHGEITVLEVVLEDAVEQVQKLLVKEQPAVLVSRGATAELLRQNFSLPVVPLAPSEIDILEAVAQAKKRSLHIGYLSYPNLTDAEFLRKALDILGVTLKYYPYRNITELSAQMEQAHYDGCEAIVGGGLRGLRLAKAYGMEGFLIYSSRSTVVGALERAQEIVTLQEQKEEEAERLRRASLAKGLVARYFFRDLVGPALRDTIHKAERFSSVHATVLIWGESGTGKELFAQSIHNNSPWSHGPFVALNCATLPEHLLESELFGYEEGAFTGAKRGGRIGLFELADGGTLFLDEIGKMSPSLQAGLLRVLQTKELRRVGGDRMIPVNVRVIAASNEDLQVGVENGSFRSDLYYRLNVLKLYLPPLRERPQDILTIVDSFLIRFKKKLGYQLHMSSEFTSAIQSYHWPGNVRELENVLERYAVLVGEGEPPAYQELLDSFPEFWTGESTELFHEPLISSDLSVQPGTLEDMEIQLISILLERCRGNKSLLAEQLGISRTTLWKKLQLH
ncbi:MAG: sigma 54-interacting transcriptional regulator [Desulfitobacteriaceae bacterium]|nr:sigma 54-interacting transcriptional regulator [Desulfitobacteriaceae bacterium]MDI6914687.1 sigma 54-interacting transcriptional regulator [Desulfitobacteriaceae bacterium]